VSAQQPETMKSKTIGESSRARKETGSFQKFARASARWTGRPIAFGLAVTVVLAWLATGPLFDFSDTWQLVINTGTTIVTFLMVFLIQNTQNRDSEAIQLKLDELLRASSGAHTALLDIEELSEAELDKLKQSYARLAKQALDNVRTGKSDLGTPDFRGQKWKSEKSFDIRS
jgi:low affinity Fe/Cu permease